MSIPLEDFNREVLESNIETNFNRRQSIRLEENPDVPFRIRKFHLRDRPIILSEQILKDIQTLNLKSVDEGGNIYGLYNCLEISEEMRDHIDLFLLKIFLWEQIPIEKSISAEEIFFRSLNEQSEFTDYLKDLRFYSMKNKIGHTEIPEGIPYVDVEGYDSLFRESDLLFWDNTDNIDDFQWSFIHPEVDEGIYEDIKIELLSIFTQAKEQISIPQQEELLSEIKNSSSLVPGTTVYQELNYHKEEIDLSTNDMFGRRLKICVKPGSDRDTVIPNISTLFKLKHDSMIMAQILNLLPESAMCSPIKLKQRFKMLSCLGWFTHLDFKKCGLTFPHVFIKAVGDIMNQLEIPNYFNDHLNTYVLDDDESIKKINSGFCLGWANELPTLAYTVVSRYIKRKYGLHHKGLFFNDDSVIMTNNSYEYAILIKNAFNTILSKMGFLMNSKKHIISHGNVFCEIYTQTDLEGFDGRKRQALSSACANSMSTNSYTICREYMSSILLYADETTTLIEYIAKSSFSLRMKSFSFQDLPYTFGGITSYKENYLNADLLYLERKGSPREISLACNFLRLFKKFKKPDMLDLRNPDKRNFKILNRKILKYRNEDKLTSFISEDIRAEAAALRLIALQEISGESLRLPEKFSDLSEIFAAEYQELIRKLYHEGEYSYRTGVG